MQIRREDPNRLKFFRLGEPTASVGTPIAAGGGVALPGAAVLSNFRAISAIGKLDVEYFH